MTQRSSRRFTILILLIAVIFSILVVRITKLMFFQKDNLTSNPKITNKIERGFIVDRNGEKLALSLETFSLYARPHEIEQKKKTAQTLSNTLGIPYTRILKQLNADKSFVWIQRQIDLKLTSELAELDLNGIYVEKEYKRYYPFNNLASHIIGSAGVDQKGLEGIEYYFDDVLLPRRLDGKNPISSPSRRGFSIVLTVDRFIQEIVEEEIKTAYEETGAQLINAIVMYPSTGEILALASFPGYDLNKFIQYSNETKRNKSITDSFEPGSTFKIFVASILLDEGVVQEVDQFNCNGSIVIGDVTIHDTGVHGVLNYRQVLEQSCNVGMIESVARINSSILYEKLRSFGFGTPTGINLPGEAHGILRMPNEWSGISKYVIAIGQEVSVTPLQLITAASALANKGVMMQPRIVRRIEKSDGTVIKEYKPTQIRRVISEDTSRQILDILIGVLSDEGTGYKARIDGYNIAGKTGTAQIADTEKGGYLEGQFYASFIGFLPVPDPKIVLLVTLDRPIGENYGGQTAAPIFKNIVERIAPHLNILPSFSEVFILEE